MHFLIHCRKGKRAKAKWLFWGESSYIVCNLLQLSFKLSCLNFMLVQGNSLFVFYWITILPFLLIWFPSPNCPSPSLLVAAALAPVLREASICCCAPLRSALCLILRWELASILSLLCSSSSLFSFVFLWFPFLLCPNCFTGSWKH